MIPRSYNSLSVTPDDHAAAARLGLGLDMAALRETAAALVDLVLTDDYAYMDALPDAVQIAALPPLGMLAEALEDGAADGVVVAAVRAVTGSMRGELGLCPRDMRELIEALEVSG